MSIDSVLGSLPDMEAGVVWLAGAGPGDPGLLSLLTLKGLQQAEVVVYDALVAQEIIELAGKEAQLEFAGKRGGTGNFHLGLVSAVHLFRICTIHLYRAQNRSGKLSRH